MHNFTFCLIKQWDLGQLGQAKKALPLPLGLTISDLSTYFQMKSPKGKHSQTMNLFNNLWSGSFYLGLAQFSLIRLTLNDENSLHYTLLITYSLSLSLPQPALFSSHHTSQQVYCHSLYFALTSFFRNSMK
jgi:hypothetical protein